MVARSDKITVLLVEDDDLVRLFNAELLEDAGFSVIEAEHARDALEKLDRHPEVQVLFSDVDMPPGPDGLALAREVNQRRPDVGLVLTSGQARLRDADLPDAGRFIPKPFRPDAVVRLIEQAARQP